MPISKTFQPIEWTDDMATGIAAIDKQHRYLVDTLQEANVKLPGEKDDTRLCQIARNLLGYAIMHFETEEELMQRYGYPAEEPENARIHITQHRDFSRWLVAVCDQIREDQTVSHTEILKYLNHWLRDHMLGVDRSLCEFLRRKMNEPAP